MVLSGLMSFGVLFAAAQGGAPTATLTLDEALKIALDNNPTIQIAGLEIERVDYSRKETWGNHLPSVTGSVSYTYNAIRSTMDFGGQKVSLMPENIFTPELSLSLPLFVPSIYRALKMNDEQRRAAVENVRGSRIDLAAEVKKAYYNVLLAKQSLAVLKDSEKTTSETVDMIRASYDNGLASEYDLLTAEVRLNNIKPLIIQSEGAVSNLKGYLKMLLGLPEEGLDIDVAGALPDFEGAVAASGGARDMDISDNSTLRSLDIQEALLKQQYKVAGASRLPTLAAFGQFQYAGQDKISFSFSEDGSGSGKSVWEWQHPLVVGAKLSIPIFSGMTNVRRQQQIKVGISQLQLQRDYARKGVETQLQTALVNINTARGQMQANSLAVEQAKKAYSIASTRYKAGAGTILELNNAELAHTQTQLSYSQSIYDYLSAEAEYDKILGRE